MLLILTSSVLIRNKNQLSGSLKTGLAIELERFSNFILFQHVRSVVPKALFTQQKTQHTHIYPHPFLSNSHPHVLSTVGVI